MTNKDVKHPNPKGIKIYRLMLATASIIYTYIPRTNIIAEPEIPGIKKKLKAMNPYAIRGKNSIFTELKSIKLRMNVIKIPNIKNRIFLQLKIDKSLIKYKEAKIIVKPKNNSNTSV